MLQFSVCSCLCEIPSYVPTASVPDLGACSVAFTSRAQEQGTAALVSGHTLLTAPALAAGRTGGEFGTTAVWLDNAQY